MTEQEWLESTDPIRMLEVLEKRRIPAHRLRLFAAICCRRAWPELTDGRSHAAIEALEMYADGPGKQSDKEELTSAHVAAEAVVAGTIEDSRPFWVARCVAAASEPTEAWWVARWAADLWLTAVGKSDSPAGKRAARGARKQEAAHLANLLRDVIGNPRRRLTFDPAWLTPTVLALAQTAYEERQLPSGHLDADRLAVLADVLEDVGAAAELLEHLRGPGPHVRGCHVLDLLLGRS